MNLKNGTELARVKPADVRVSLSRFSPWQTFVSLSKPIPHDFTGTRMFTKRTSLREILRRKFSCKIDMWLWDALNCVRYIFERTSANCVACARFIRWICAILLNPIMMMVTESATTANDVNTTKACGSNCRIQNILLMHHHELAFNLVAKYAGSHTIYWHQQQPDWMCKPPNIMTS